MINKNLKTKKNKNSKIENNENIEDNNNNNDDNEEKEEDNIKINRKRDEPNGGMDDPNRQSKRLRTTIDQNNVSLISKALSQVFRKERTDNITIDNLETLLKEQNINISREELNNILQHLHDVNKLFLNEDTIHQL